MESPSEKIIHAVATRHDRFPRTRCSRTLDLARERRHRVTTPDAPDINCLRCLEAIGSQR